MSGASTPGFRCGTIAVVGRPNVGKSTLVNALVGQKVTITSSKPQTTRYRITGILTRPGRQYVFVDTPGFQTHEGGVLNRLLNRAVQHALARPMFATPGAVMEYSTGNSHLLSAVLTKATGMSTRQFANEALFKPIGSVLPEWPRDPQGIYFGGNDMLMTPRQMVAFGELYLNRGRFSGRQIVSERWVAKSCEGRAREFRPGERTGRRIRTEFVDPMRDWKYGYSWWVHELGGHEACFAWGYGGQYIFVVPDLDMVIVTTASPDVSEERRGHRQQVFDILLRHVVGSLAPTR